MLYQPEDEGRILEKMQELCQERMFKQEQGEKEVVDKPARNGNHKPINQHFKYRK